MTMPLHLTFNEGESVVYDPLKSAALDAWGCYWFDNQDSSLSPWARVNHICGERSNGDGLGYVPLMPIGVEHVDSVIAGLSWSMRLAAWEWWVINRQISLTGCAEGVKHKLRKTSDAESRYSRKSLQIDLACVVGTVAGRVEVLSLGDPEDEDCADWWLLD